jgi:TRAP-type C4-dicarboxylate transport system substrate-binding protein
MERGMNLIKASLVVAAALIGLGGNAMAKTQWIMVSGYPESNYLTKNLRMFVDEVQKAGKGELEIALNTNDSLIKLDNIKRAVQTGQVQGGEIRLGVYGNEDPMYILDGVPFLAADYKSAWALMEAQKPYFETLFQKNGMRIVGFQPWPAQGFYTRTPVTSPDDFKGKRLRIYSTVTQKMGALLGFNATILPFAEIPQAFSTGLIDSLFTSAQTGIDIQAWDNTKHFTNVGALYSKNAVIINDRAYQRLSPEMKQAVAKAGENFSKRGWEMSAAANAEQVATLVRNGMQVADAPASVITKLKASPDAIAALNIYMAKAASN